MNLVRYGFYLVLVLCTYVCISISSKALTQEQTEDSKPAATQTLITKLELELEFIGEPPSGVVSDRLYTAIYSTLETAIIEQLEADLNAVKSDKEQIVDILTGILNLVLPRRGYKIAAFTIEPDVTTKVKVVLEQFSQVIRQYDVELIIERQAPALAESRLMDSIELQKLLKDNLNNVPYTDSNFARQAIENYLKNNWLNVAPWNQFEPTLDIIPGEKTVVRVKLTTASGTRQLNYSFAKVRSTSLINLTLTPLRSKFSSMISDLDGLPTVYLQPRLHFVGKAIMKLVDQDKISRKLRAYGNVSFYNVDDRLYAVLRLESKSYFLEGDAIINFNTNDKEAELNAMLGLKADNFTFYSGWQLLPGLMDFNYEAGVAYNTYGTFIGGSWDFQKDTIKTRFKQQLYNDFEIDIEAYFEDKHRDKSIYSLRYRFGDNYSLGVAIDNEGRTRFFLQTSL